MNQQNQEIKGAVRIGSGTKLHPAIKDQHYGLIIRCGCPDTRQGSAYHSAKFFVDAKSTCKN